MTTTKTGSSIERSGCAQRMFGGVAPSEDAEAELRWFFNEAEAAVEMPSNYQGLIAGASPTSMDAVERRLEAMHAARKISERLQGLRATDARLLAGLYTERPWSGAVLGQLPGGLAGAAAASVRVRMEYVRALASARTRVKSVSEYIEEVVRLRRCDLLAAWRVDLAPACALAVYAYEQARGGGPSVVPEEDV
jgi:hypothetical protein